MRGGVAVSRGLIVMPISNWTRLWLFLRIKGHPFEFQVMVSVT
jgi:hypothetical protein